MRPTNLHPKDEEQLILNLEASYLMRYHACNRILQAYQISTELSSIRKVFPLICKDYTSISDRQLLQKNYEEALKNLLDFVAHYGEKPDYHSFSKEEINNAFLDECYNNQPNADKLRQLLDLGADMHLSDASMRTPAYIRAMRADKIELLQLFLERGGDVNYQYPPHHNSDAHYYLTYWLNNIMNTPLPQIQLMLKHGARLHDRDHNGNNALHIIGESRVNMDVLRLFVEMGIDIQAANNIGETPLLRFCKLEVNLEAASYLLDCGANAKAQNVGASTPLHLVAAWYDDKTGFIMKLRQHGADPNAQDSLGQTPLFIAVSRNNERITQALLGVGANAQIANKNGKNPYQLALEQGFMKVAMLLNENAENEYMNRPEYPQIQRLKTSIIGALKSGKSWSRADREGWLNLNYKNGKYILEMGEHQSDYHSTYEYDEAGALQYMYNGLGYYDKLNKTELQMWESVARWLGISQ